MEGAPSNVFALAQTTDGTLWIGGGTGLTRFDGVRFVLLPRPLGRAPAVDISVTSLIASLTVGCGSVSVRAA